MLRTLGCGSGGGGPPSGPLSVQSGREKLTHATVAVVTPKQPAIFSFANKFNEMTHRVECPHPALNPNPLKNTRLCTS